MTKDFAMALPFTGERFVPEQVGNIAIEHLHRYLVARSSVAGKRVLDIACGEGYGSALLAEQAEQVIGVDIDPDTIKHAVGKYRQSNLEFLVGDCADIPLADNSVDVIVSFETLEHHDKHERMMLEFKRVLVPGGVIIISSPDKKYYSDERNFSNEFHVKELYEEEFKKIIKDNFKNYRIFSQRIIFGSAFSSNFDYDCIKNYIYENGEAREVGGVVRPYYHIALASDGDLPSLGVGILEQPIKDSEIIQDWEKVSVRKDAQIDQLKGDIERIEAENRLVKEAHEVSIKRLETALEQNTAEFRCERLALQDLSQRQQEEISRLERERARIIASHSWKLTRPLRVSRRLLDYSLKGGAPASDGTPAVRYSTMARLRNGTRYLLRGDVKGFVNRLKFYRRENEQWKSFERVRRGELTNWAIIATPHTLFIARSIADRLAAHGIGSEIMTSPPEKFDHDFYVVLCAQMFERLPPSDRRILFQLEQSVSSRWFTDEYIGALESSFAVFEYSLNNIEYLEGQGIKYPHVYYLPIGISSPEVDLPSAEEKEYDFLFYGDSNSSPRRQRMLAELQKHFRVKIHNNLFGEEMHQAIRRARIVVNIHYYDGALLEMPRIQECIALGVPLLSEGSSDQGDYPELAGAVCFFKEDSIDDMLVQARNMLANIEEHVQGIKCSARKSFERFEFMFDRALVSLGFLPETSLLKKIPYLPSDSNIIALSLPETIQRRRALEVSKPGESGVFDGARYKPGWVGCGMSFRLLASYALEKKFDRLTVFEDDALLPDEYETRIRQIHQYLNGRQQPWDVFSGMIAEIHPDTKVFSVDIRNGTTYVTIDRMTSMVYNIYNKSALEVLSQWDPTNRDVDRNTVDRYLQKTDNLKIVISLPFLAGHREELHSTLWGFQNTQYTSMIAKAEKQLQELADRWLSKNKAMAVSEQV